MDALELWALTDGFATIDDIVRQRLRAQRGLPADLSLTYSKVDISKPVMTAHKPATVRPVRQVPRVSEPIDSSEPTDSQLTPQLRKLAHEYVRNYTGSFEFILKLRSWTGPLTDSQCIAALKCLKAELKHKQAAPKQSTVPDAITNALKLSAKGEFRCAARNRQGTLSFYRVRQGTGRWEGYVFLSAIAGPNEHPIKNADTRTAILHYLAGDIQEYINAYGREIGTCGNCGLRLTDETSRMIGMGPICRAKW